MDGLWFSALVYAIFSNNGRIGIKRAYKNYEVILFFDIYYLCSDSYSK
jgi:hypothetical protein